MKRRRRDRPDETTIPLAEEEVYVGKREVERGRVRLTRRVHEEEHPITATLLSEHVEVDRVPVDELVDSPPEVRREGDTLIVPCVEEVLIVEKRLRVREEIRIRTVREEVETKSAVTVRREKVDVERVPPDPHRHT